MSATYYDRQVSTHLDGSPVFATDEDRRSEQTVAEQIESAWQCELHRFGELSPLDWFAVRVGRVVGVLELKSRSHSSEQYPTVFLNVRKWLALELAATGLGVPALFVVRFTDQLRWIRAGANMGAVRIAGCRSVVKARSDIEPVIEVPVTDMRELA